ncbi:hypothetical protein ES707_12993 [subsurface metagenome]
MSIFSDESVLLIKNWEAVRDIINAKQRLEKEMTQFLHSLEMDFKKTDWWHNRWVFTKYSWNGVYISKRDWELDKEYAVWIGVQTFTPENLFGYEANAELYVWVPAKWRNLTVQLTEQVADKESDIIGEIAVKASSGYIIRHAVTQCLPEEIDSFEERTRSQIINFIAHYAHVIEKYDRLIKESLAE